MQDISKKVILIGNFGVGKTSLVKQFVYQKFSDDYLTTLGVRIDKKTVVIGETNVNMIIWDVAGEVSQTKVPSSYYLGAHAFIYVFDLTRPSTFVNIEEDLEYVKKFIPKAHVCITGNKKDILTPEELDNINQTMVLKPNFFTSALTGENVEKMFYFLAEQMAL
jgi:small GTP-binding protein